MSTSELRIGIIGCGRSSRIHVERLRAVAGTEVVGCADINAESARTMAESLPGSVPHFTEAKELLTRTAPQAVSIFASHRAHYRLAMDALQAGCHVFIEKPLSTNLQEAHDIVKLARARSRKVGVGHQFRLSPNLVEARRLLAEGAIGRLRLVTAVLARPWLAGHSGPSDTWRLDPRVSGGGILADAGDHLLDSLLWTTGRTTLEVAAIQERLSLGLDVVTAASLRLSDAVLATIAVTGVAAAPVFELTFHGEAGKLRATPQGLWRAESDVETAVSLPGEASIPPSIDANFIAAVRDEAPLCCPAEDAIETVRLLEALGRSAVSGQVVRLS